MAFSHWVLDLIVHHPDLPILPGNAGNLPLLGFGLWGLPTVAALVELALVIGGAYLYYRSATALPVVPPLDPARQRRRVYAATLAPADERRAPSDAASSSRFDVCI